MRRFLLGRSLEDCIAGGRDNILLLRLVAALLVVLGHSFVLVGDSIAAGDRIADEHEAVPEHDEQRGDETQQQDVVASAGDAVFERAT